MNHKTLGVAKNVRELKKLLEKCNDNMPVNFRNEPVHELIIENEILCFTQYRSNLYINHAVDIGECPHCKTNMKQDDIDFLVCSKCGFVFFDGTFIEVKQESTETPKPFSNRIKNLNK